MATTASAKNAEFLTSLGADEVIDYHEHQIEEVLSDYDAVFDTIDALDAGLAILKPTGKLVTIAGHPTPEQEEAQPSATAWWLQPNGKQLAELGDLVVKGEVKVIIDSTFPLTEDGLRAAHERSQTNHARGKIVINVK